MGRQDSTAQPHPAGSASQADNGAGVLVGLGAIDNVGVGSGSRSAVEPPQATSMVARQDIATTETKFVDALITRSSYRKLDFPSRTSDGSRPGVSRRSVPCERAGSFGANCIGFLRALFRGPAAGSIEHTTDQSAESSDGPPQERQDDRIIGRDPGKRQEQGVGCFAQAEAADGNRNGCRQHDQRMIDRDEAPAYLDAEGICETFLPGDMQKVDHKGQGEGLCQKLGVAKERQEIPANQFAQAIAFGKLIGECGGEDPAEQAGCGQEAQGGGQKWRQIPARAEDQRQCGHRHQRDQTDDPIANDRRQGSCGPRRCSTEVKRARTVGSQCTGDRDPEEHADEIESNIRSGRRDKADRVPEIFPSQGADDLPQVVGEECSGEPDGLHLEKDLRQLGKADVGKEDAEHSQTHEEPGGRFYQDVTSRTASTSTQVSVACLRGA